jgi:uncharacterized protein YneF (UPF0154 family)
METLTIIIVLVCLGVAFIIGYIINKIVLKEDKERKDKNEG